MKEEAPTVRRQSIQNPDKNVNVKDALDKALDLLGPLKDDVFLLLGLKYGVNFTDDYAPIKEIEDLLVILFEKGAEPLISEFRSQLRRQEYS